MIVVNSELYKPDERPLLSSSSLEMPTHKYSNMLHLQEGAPNFYVMAMNTRKSIENLESAIVFLHLSRKVCWEASEGENQDSHT